MPPRPSVAAPRPQRADARRNFEAVLAAAKLAFAEKGADASLEDIARQAGVGIGTLYRNFPTRSDLINAVYVDEVEELCRSAEDLDDLPPWDALMVWLRSFVEYCAHKRALVEGLNRDSELFTTARDAMYASPVPLLARAQASGDVRNDLEIEDLMYLVTGLMSVTYRSDEQRERVLTLALDGIRPQ
ncbi:MAG: helix-turn-helix domain-containing protein [Galbitalea sp.]